MLKVSQLSRRYGSFKAVDDVSFTINKGEIVGLLGHNGAGKTTIMKMISGYLEPNQGSIEVDGLRLEDCPKAIQMKLGYLPESLPVYPEMSVADYLDYAAELKGLQGDIKLSEIKRVVKATDITNKLLAPIATLSRGYKQRVGLAQAILGRPRLLILDEPTNGLDPAQTQHIRQLIRDIAKDATVILSTHIMQEVEALCHRVLMLRAGTLAVDAKLEDLKQSNHLILESDFPEVEMEAINSIEGVNSWSWQKSAEDSSAYPIYRIALQSKADHKIIAAEIAERVFQSGKKIYQLFSEHRDLETLFKEINEEQYQKEDLSNAA